jgi:hypothetical protein
MTARPAAMAKATKDLELVEAVCFAVILETVARPNGAWNGLDS